MFRTPKTIKQIYTETRDFDLVITNDPALATGLNRLVDKPRLGTFALTPRQSAARYGAMVADKIYKQDEIVADIFQRTKIPVRVLHPSVEKIFDVWKNTGLLESCELYLSKEDVKLAKIIREYPTLELLMEEFDEDFFGERSLAVLGKELFNLLDLQVLPRKKQYTDVQLFTGETDSPIDKTFVFSSSNDLVNAVVERITKENQNAVSVVMNFNSPYLPVLKSRLKLKGIDIIDNITLAQDSLTRDFVRSIGMSFMKEDLLVSDVRQVSDSLGICISEAFNDWSFGSYAVYSKDDEGIKKLSAFINDLNGKKYSYAVEEFQRVFGKKLNEHLIHMLDILGLSKSKISEDNYSDLNYFLRFIDVEIDKCSDGVLFANSLNSVYINREIVFYLGMDASWTKRVGDVEYIDKKEEERKNLEKFQILLSQGEQKFYFAQSVSNGQKTIPCHYFNLLVNKSIDGFDSPFFNMSLPKVSMNEPAAFSHDAMRERTHVRFEDVSQSKLNNYYSCPKRFSFNLLIPVAQSPAMLRGDLLHKFAEFCFDYPDFCEKNFDKILNALLREFDRYGSGDDGGEDASVFSIAMMQIYKFIAGLEIKKIESESKKSDNFLYTEFKKQKLYNNTELFFHKVPPGMKGRIDLIGDDTIYDFKTSAKHSPSSYVKSSVMSLLEAKKSPDANFQTTMYLIYALKIMKDAVSPVFTYLFPLAAKAEVISNKEVKMPDSVIKYIPKTVAEYFSDESKFNELRNNVKSKLFKHFTYETWKKLIALIRSDIESGSDQLKEIRQKVQKLVSDEMRMDHTNFGRDDEIAFIEKDIEPIVNIFKDFRTPRSQAGMIFKNDLEEIENYIKSALSKMNEMAETVFPAKPAFNKRKVCYDCDYLVNCTGNKLWEGSSSLSDYEESGGG